MVIFQLAMLVFLYFTTVIFIILSQLEERISEVSVLGPSIFLDMMNILEPYASIFPKIFRSKS